MKNFKLKATYAGLKARKPFGMEHFFVFLFLVGLEFAVWENLENVLIGKTLGVILLLNTSFCVLNMILSYATVWLCRFVWALCRCFGWLEEYLTLEIEKMRR